LFGWVIVSRQLHFHIYYLFIAYCLISKFFFMSIKQYSIFTSKFKCNIVGTCVGRILQYFIYAYVQCTTHQTIHSGFCTAFISRALALISNYKCIVWRAADCKTYTPLTLYSRRGSRGISDNPPRHQNQNDLAMRSTADVTDFATCYVCSTTLIAVYFSCEWCSSFSRLLRHSYFRHTI
jgi:hypothetical protein